MFIWVILHHLLMVQSPLLMRRIAYQRHNIVFVNFFREAGCSTRILSISSFLTADCIVLIIMGLLLSAIFFYLPMHIQRLVRRGYYYFTGGDLPIVI
jgi:hypothetical protein